MWIGLIQPVEGLNRTKGWFLPANPSKGKLFLLPSLVFPAFTLDLKYWLFPEPLDLNYPSPLALPVLRPSNSDWSYPIGSPGSPPYQPQILGLVSLHDGMSQFFMINLTHTNMHAHIHTHYYFCFSREPQIIHLGVYFMCVSSPQRKIKDYFWVSRINQNCKMKWV